MLVDGAIDMQDKLGIGIIRFALDNDLNLNLIKLTRKKDFITLLASSLVMT